MVDSFSINDGMRTSRIVAHHSPERGAVCRGSIRAKEKSRGLQMQIELFLNHSGFDEGPTFFCVYLEYAVQVFGHVHHNSFAYGLPCEAGPPASGKHGNVEVPCNFHRSEHILMCA